MTAMLDRPTASAPTARNRRRKIGRFLRSSLAGRLTFPVAVLAVWILSFALVTAIWPFTVDVLPTPWQVGDFMWDEIRGSTLAPYNVYQTFGISLRRLGAGWVIAIALGTVIGLGMGLSKSINAFFNDLVVAILAMPNLAWALFGSLAFGFGNTGPIVAVVLTGIPFMIINVREGVRNTPSDLLDMSRAFQIPRARVIWHVLLPSLMPFLFAGARYSFALGWKGLVVAEVFGGQDGAGWTIRFWYDAARSYGVVGYALFFVIFAILVEKVMFDRLSNRLFRWRPEVVGIPEKTFNAPASAVNAGSITTTAELESSAQTTIGTSTRRDRREGKEKTTNHG